METLTFPLKHREDLRDPARSVWLAVPGGTPQESCDTISFNDPGQEVWGWLVILPGSSSSRAGDVLPYEQRLLTLFESYGEGEESVTRLAGGDRAKIIPLDPSDPLYCLKARYNEAIGARERMISVMSLFPGLK